MSASWRVNPVEVSAKFRGISHNIQRRHLQVSLLSISTLQNLLRCFYKWAFMWVQLKFEGFAAKLIIDGHLKPIDSCSCVVTLVARNFVD